MNYNLFTTKGYFRYSDICFGGLNSLPFPISALLNESMNYSHFVATVAFNNGSISPDEIIAIDYPLSQAVVLDKSTHEESRQFWEREIPQLLSELRIYQGGWAYNEEDSCVRVYTNQPYDRMMTLLFLLRNLTYHSGTSRSYAKLRESGFTALESAIGCHFCALSYSFSGNFRPSPVRIGEYNWFNPQTMSLSSTIDLLKQKPVQWFGCNFDDSEAGYVRDYTFGEDGIRFMDFIGEDDYEGYYDEDDDDEYPLNGQYYKLVDVFSNKDDYNPPMPSVQSNPINGGHCVNIDLDNFDTFIEAFRDLTVKAKSDSTN